LRALLKCYFKLYNIELLEEVDKLGAGD
jgi:hypothetical protein